MPRSLVPLKPTGGRLPVFARPGHNGDVFCYRPLAEHLDPLQPLFGVEPEGVGGGPIPETVEEIAAYEVDQIRRFQPVGPYHLAGFCAGGAIAYESARQLAGAGEDVARVLLFGSPFPTTYRAGPLGLNARSLTDRVRRHTSAATAGSLAEGLGYVRGRVSVQIAKAAERHDPALANRRRMETATLAAVRRYEPGFYAGRIDLFLPNEAWRRSPDRPDEWKQVAGRVIEHVGPAECNGDNMLLEPHVGVVAALLDKALADEGRPQAVV